MKLPHLNGLATVGFVGERKAVALLFLGFYTTYFCLLTLLARTELPEYVPMFGGLLALYIVAFLGVGAEWFWGRWFATGIGYWGLTMTIMVFVTTRSLPTALVIFGAMHGAVALLLMGEKMAAVFDAKPAWRARWKLDEQGVIRVRKSVTRAASSLPALIMFALAPREGQGGLYAAPRHEWFALLLLGVALVGLVGLLTSRRTWAVLSLGVVGVAVLWLGLGSTIAAWGSVARLDYLGVVPLGSLPLLALLAGSELTASALPFVGPIARYVRRR